MIFRTARFAMLALAAAVCLGPSLPAEGHLKVEAGVAPLRLVRGQEGRVVLKVVVPEGIVVSTLPSFTIELEPSEDLLFPKDFFTASDLNVETLEIRGRTYLSLKKPVEVPFTVSPKAKRGVHVLEGKIKYFACSLGEGWCLKSSARFRATFSTRLASPGARP